MAQRQPCLGLQVVSLCAFACITSLALADVVISSQITTVSASAMASDGVSVIAIDDGGVIPGFGSVSDSASADASLTSNDLSTANALLAFTLNSESLVLSGSVASDVDGDELMTAGTASAISSITITFSVTSETPWHFADAQAFGIHADANISLSVGEQSLFNSSVDDPEEVSGTFLPLVSYTLSISCSAYSDYLFFNGLFADASYSCDLRLTSRPPVCRADFDGDGFLTFEDFDAFVAFFEVGDPSADFDGDGFLTFEDFDAFVAAFEAGC